MRNIVQKAPPPYSLMVPYQWAGLLTHASCSFLSVPLFLPDTVTTPFSVIKNQPLQLALDHTTSILKLKEVCSFKHSFHSNN